FELGISEGTVKQHIHSIYKKLGITSRTQALLKAQEMGLV
ncbi:MAG: DNA-binding response regulator, partial [Zetaproteobacteria bacterium CG_4_8_14_3_um_filter_59_5]